MTCRNGVKKTNSSIDTSVSTDKPYIFNIEQSDLDISCSCCKRVTGNPINSEGSKVPIKNNCIFVPCEPYEVKSDLKVESNLSNKTYFRRILNFVGMKSPLEKKSESRKTLTGLYDRI